MAEKNYRLKRYYVELGEHLRHMRVKSGLSQRDVSRKLGYSSAQFISNFENGIVQPPLKKLTKLIALYKMPAEPLIKIMLKEHEKKIRRVLR